MPQISINDAVELAKIMGRIKAQLHRGNYGSSGEFVRELAQLRLAREHVQPALDEINRKCGYNADKQYDVESRFYPLPTAAARVAEPDDNPCMFQGVNLNPLIHGPDHDNNPQPFPFEKAFARLKIAGREDGEFWIEPYHEHTNGARCCYVHDWGKDDNETGDCYSIMCTQNDGEFDAFRVRDYLEKGLISLDELAPLLYGVTTSEALPDPPSGTYPDNSLGLYILDGVEPIRVCNFVHAVAEVEDELGIHRGRQIRFWDGKAWQLHTIVARLLEGEGAALYQELAQRGLDVSSEPAARAAFRKIVKEPSSLPTVIEYSRPGWHAHRFVLPTGLSLAADCVGMAQVYVARISATVDRTQGGTYDAWVKGVAEEIWKGDCPQFAMGQLAGCVGVLTSLLKCEHPVIHFSGPPSSGKTTAQEIAAGLTCNPAPGMGTLVTLQDDVTVVLPKGFGTSAHIDDPTKRGSPTKVERLMYEAMEKTPFTVSSVASLEQIVEAAGGKMNEGIRRRVITVDTRKAPRIDPSRARRIKRAAQENYGHAAPYFLEHLMTLQAHMKRDLLLQQADDYADAMPGDKSDPEIYSASRHIGVLALTGELLRGAGLIPPEADVAGVLLDVWNDWLERRSATPINRAVAAIDAALHDAEPLPQKACFDQNSRGGPWQNQGVGYLPVNLLQEIIGEELPAKVVIRHLKETGRLKPCSGKNMAWPNLDLPGAGRVACPHYRITLA